MKTKTKGIMGMVMVMLLLLLAAPMRVVRAEEDPTAAAHDGSQEPPKSRFETPLLQSADQNDLSKVKELVEAGADPNEERRGIVPLHLAIRNHNLDMVNFLLQNGANPNFHNPSGENPAMLAIIQGDEGTIRAVLSAEALDIYYENPFGYNVMHVIGQYGSVLGLKILEERGFAKWNALNEFQDAPLHLALKFAQREVAKYLIRKPEVDVTTPNNHQWTPFLLAVVDGDVDIVRYLKENRGADDKALTADQETALHRAIQHHNNEVAAYLVENLGHKVDSLDAHGWTPLHFAVLLGNEEGFGYLIQQGADHTLQTYDEVDIYIINERSKHTNKPTKEKFLQKFALLAKKDAEEEEIEEVIEEPVPGELQKDEL